MLQPAGSAGAALGAGSRCSLRLSSGDLTAARTVALTPAVRLRSALLMGLVGPAWRYDIGVEPAQARTAAWLVDAGWHFL